MKRVRIACLSVLAIAGVLGSRTVTATRRADWIALTVTCEVKSVATGITRSERIFRAADGSQRSESRHPPAPDVDVQIRNRRLGQYYRHLPDGEWLTAPLLSRSEPPTLASFQRSDRTFTDTTFEGRRAIVVEAPSIRFVVVPDFDYLSVSEDSTVQNMTCKGVDQSTPDPGLFVLPVDQRPRGFANIADLNAYVAAKKKTAANPR
jgi:hypothetical protein